MGDIVMFPGKKPAATTTQEEITVVIHRNGDDVVGFELRGDCVSVTPEGRRAISGLLRMVELSVQRSAAEEQEDDSDVLVAAYIKRGGSATVHAYDMTDEMAVEWAREMLDAAKDGVTVEQTGTV